MTQNVTCYFPPLCIQYYGVLTDAERTVCTRKLNPLTGFLGENVTSLRMKLRRGSRTDGIVLEITGTGAVALTGF